MGVSQSKIKEESHPPPEVSETPPTGLAITPPPSPRSNIFSALANTLPPSPRSSIASGNNSPLRALFSAFSPALQVTAPPPHFRFMDLPVELRVMIYEEVLVVGKVFFTPDKHDLENGKRCSDYKLFRKPELQLLRVCKQIQSEAEPIYASKNLFVLPLDWYNFEPVLSQRSLQYEGTGKTSPVQRNLISAAGITHLRNLSFAMDYIPPSVHDDFVISNFGSSFWEMWEESAGYSFDVLSPLARYEYIHEAWEGMASRVWREITVVLDQFPGSLDYVELDFTNIFCPQGHCRALLPIMGHFVKKLNATTLDVIGLRTKEERSELIKLARDAGVSHQVLRQKHGLRFRRVGDSTPWDKWRIEEVAETAPN